jgi:hypothetical protein
MTMTRELAVQNSPAAVLAAAINEIQNRHLAARLRATALAAEQAAAYGHSDAA